MSNHLGIYCRAEKILPVKQLVDYIKDGVFFEEIPHFGGADLNQADYFEIEYEVGRRPVQIERTASSSELFRLVIEEELERLYSYSTAKVPSSLIEHLQATCQYYSFDFAWSASEECNEMVYQLSRFVARELDGIIYDGQSYLDQDLKPIFRVS
jgi:hypothetical protein